MSLLESIVGPRDLRSLSRAQLERLADEIRAFLITNVSRTGGHLGPNLGVVELTMAVHRVFDSPHDPIVFDTGHQSYVHKILTGRAAEFPTLRQQGGLSGYPEPAESEHDWVANSHASAALSWAEGMAKGYALRGEDRTVVAVVGDGALTGGMAWEALNNIAAQPELQLVIVVNDNGRSYTPTVGGLANHLAGLRTDPRYEQTLSLAKRVINKIPVIGRPLYDLMHGFKTGVKDVVAPQDLFSDLGIKYTGPIDGHDLGALTNHLEQARQFGGPVIVHTARSTTSPASRSRRPYRPRGPTRSPRRWCSWGSATSASSRSRPRCCTRRGSPASPRRSPTARSTWASPSSTRSPRRRAWRALGCTPSSPCTRPS